MEKVTRAHLAGLMLFRDSIDKVLPLPFAALLDDMIDQARAASEIDGERAQCDECGGNGAGGDHEDDCSKSQSDAESLRGALSEIIEKVKGSRTVTRRLMWIEGRAQSALEGKDMGQTCIPDA